ncbi:MAG: resolvase [Candidatus Raymondbacteria bacterium RIFOXYC2_FULL_50_21]|uniref:Resolvase n=1 Tax=Candidatus Raymondbacteria bacterium RIFOXYD12_FULL_49_13 TaxID=1817890 RepID=A0A1F7FAM7_UNCRA|nr:MAG: resolvase [Candidatus Raymondbacteria bacterium RIFOXYC2_FULL_50_21]OGK03572.1 MAG: resolvase [Candidatus Raymondbacteria bacterium RIFOXYD12_FULL_49_13]
MRHQKIGTLVGYARVSTQDQNLNLQNDALKAAGCKKIYRDKASGAAEDRKGLSEAIEYMRKGDTLVIWKLDRLGRSLRHLIDVVKSLNDRGIGLKSLQENIDTTTSGGKLIFHMFGSLAEFERDIIRERTLAGLKAARARGRRGGRPSVMDAKKIQMAKVMLKDKNNSIADICRTLGLSKATLYRYAQ